jgi:hypothetical protein
MFTLSHLCIYEVVEFSSMRRAEQSTLTEKMRNSNKKVSENLKGRDNLRDIGIDNIKMGLTEMGCEGV